jgi:hypothetical protein
MAWLERRVELLVEKQSPRIHKLAFALWKEKGFLVLRSTKS